MKIKESEKIDKYLDHARKLIKLGNMKVMVVPIVVSALGMVPKVVAESLEELEIRGRTDTTQTTLLLKSVRIVSPDD